MCLHLILKKFAGWGQIFMNRINLDPENYVDKFSSNSNLFGLILHFFNVNSWKRNFCNSSSELLYRKKNIISKLYGKEKWLKKISEKFYLNFVLRNKRQTKIQDLDLIVAIIKNLSVKKNPQQSQRNNWSPFNCEAEGNKPSALLKKTLPLALSREMFSEQLFL